MSVKSEMAEFLLRGAALPLLARASPRTIIWLLRLLHLYAFSLRPRYQTFGQALNLLKHYPSARQLLERGCSELSVHARKRLIETLAISPTLSAPIRAKRRQNGLAAPYLIVFSPLSRCNLRCLGCYAGMYGKRPELSYKVMDRLITEAKAVLGIRLFTISGGEPLLRKDLFDLYKRHNDCFFIMFTNATLIDQGLAKRIARLGNVVPCISLEGFEKETDARRGPGVYAKVMQAMDYLRWERVLFFFSVTATRRNYKAVGSDDFIDLMVGKGALGGYFFIFMPVGSDADEELMLFPEERCWLTEQVWHFRKTRPIVPLDFWGDGHLTSGCIAFGRLYLHVTNDGGIDPCVFLHYRQPEYNVNKGTTLAEVLESPLFVAGRSRFPWTDNLRTPCPIIDHNEVLCDVVSKCGACPSHPGADKVTTDFVPFLRAYGERMEELTRPTIST